MIADDKYSLRNSGNLRDPIEMQLYKILETFSQHFAQLVQSTSNFKQFEKKMFLLPYVFSKFPTVKGTVTQMFKYHRAIAPSYGQHVKQSKTLVKCPWEYFYQTCLLLWSKLTWETSLSYWYLNSCESLLRHWLPITGILFVIFAICRYYIKCNDLKN